MVAYSVTDVDRAGKSVGQVQKKKERKKSHNSDFINQTA